MDFAVIGPLVRPALPDIRFLFIGSRVSFHASFRRRLAAVALALHMDFTSIRLSGGLAPPGRRTCSTHLCNSSVPAGLSVTGEQGHACIVLRLGEQSNQEGDWIFALPSRRIGADNGTRLVFSSCDIKSYNAFCQNTLPWMTFLLVRFLPGVCPILRSGHSSTVHPA